MIEESEPIVDFRMIIYRMYLPIVAQVTAEQWFVCIPTTYQVGFEKRKSWTFLKSPKKGIVGKECQ